MDGAETGGYGEGKNDLGRKVLRRSTDLNPGVSLAELKEAETALGFPLPADFKASYAIHNGAGGNGLLMGSPLLRVKAE